MQKSIRTQLKLIKSYENVTENLNIMNHETAYFTSQTPPDTEGRVDEYIHVVYHGIHLRHFVN